MERFRAGPAVEFINWKAYSSVPGTTALILLDWQVGNCAAKTVYTVIEIAGINGKCLGMLGCFGTFRGYVGGVESEGFEKRGWRILCTWTWIRKHGEFLGL